MDNHQSQHARDLKAVMRQLPFPVVIVTTAVKDKKLGITIGSFTSLSMDPPLISFNVDKQARIYELLDRATHFAVHIPQPEQSEFCDHFAAPGKTGGEQFEVLEYRRNSFGNPIITNIATVIQCRAHNKFPGGDHAIFVGEVIDIVHATETPSVLYYDRSYRSLTE